MSDVVVYKLSTGEEILGKVQSSDEKNVTLEDVRIVVVSPNQSGQFGVSFIPFMFSQPEGEVVINRSTIVGSSTPISDFEKGYLSQVSGIDLSSHMG